MKKVTNWNRWYAKIDYRQGQRISAVKTRLTADQVVQLEHDLEEAHRYEYPRLYIWDCIHWAESMAK